ncbi:deaminase domain-containing protein [Kitasatospora sp. MMS16-BH015]|uniref:deaminase domain-containing protein n=1 Tax=Kitasatospora sp. MMS16-BH015 TaxID=2018025 RepID=UPI00352E0DDF
MPKNPIFDPSGRESDSEWQVLENLAEGLTPRSSGTVNMYSEREVCPSCQSVIQQFQERFPGVTINVTTG